MRGVAVPEYMNIDLDRQKVTFVEAEQSLLFPDGHEGPSEAMIFY